MEATFILLFVNSQVLMRAYLLYIFCREIGTYWCALAQHPVRSPPEGCEGDTEIRTMNLKEILILKQKNRCLTVPSFSNSQADLFRIALSTEYSGKKKYAGIPFWYLAETQIIFKDCDCYLR